MAVGLGSGCSRRTLQNGARAAELVNDYLEKVEKPSDTRQLLFFLINLHLYPEELSTIAEYLRNRQNHLQDAATHNHSPHPLRPVMPPFLRGRRCCLHRCYPPPQALMAETPPGMGEHSATPHITPPGPYPKTKPPHGPSHPPFYTQPSRPPCKRKRTRAT